MSSSPWCINFLGKIRLKKYFYFIQSLLLLVLLSGVWTSVTPGMSCIETSSRRICSSTRMASSSWQISGWPGHSAFLSGTGHDFRGFCSVLVTELELLCLFSTLARLFLRSAKWLELSYCLTQWLECWFPLENPYLLKQGQFPKFTYYRYCFLGEKVCPSPSLALI